MTIYAGEYVRIGVTARIQTSPDVYENLTNVDVEENSITIWNTDDEEVLSAEFTWNEDSELWIYDWDTTDEPSGRYIVRAMFTGPGPHRTWEYSRIQLKTDLAPVAP